MGVEGRRRRKEKREEEEKDVCARRGGRRGEGRRGVEVWQVAEEGGKEGWVCGREARCGRVGGWVFGCGWGQESTFRPNVGFVPEALLRLMSTPIFCIFAFVECEPLIVS